MAVDIQTWLAAVGAAFGGAGIWKALDYYARFRQQGHDFKAEERRDIVSQYAALVEQQKADIKQVESEIRRLNDAVRRCEIDREALGGELKLKDVVIANMEGGGSLGIANRWQDTVIIADSAGVIQKANPAASVLLHYDPDEIVGISLYNIFPVDYHERLRLGYRKLIETGVYPDHDKIQPAHVRTKEGRREPVTVQLTAWESRDGNFTVGFTIRQRQPDAAEKEAQRFTVM